MIYHSSMSSVTHDKECKIVYSSSRKHSHQLWTSHLISSSRTNSLISRSKENNLGRFKSRQLSQMQGFLFRCKRWSLQKVSKPTDHRSWAPINQPLLFRRLCSQAWSTCLWSSTTSNLILVQRQVAHENASNQQFQIVWKQAKTGMLPSNLSSALLVC